MKPIVLSALFAILFQISAFAGGFQSGNKGGHSWYISPRIGSNTLKSEISSDFSESMTEFNNQSGFRGDFSVSRTLGNHWEPGIRIGLMKLTGNIDTTTHLSAWGRHPQFYSLAEIESEYSTSSFTADLFLRYYFRSFFSNRSGGLSLDPYIEVSYGRNRTTTELYYSGPGRIFDEEGEELESKTIFAIGRDENYKPNFVNQLGLGLGTRVTFNQDWSLIVAYEFSKVSSEYLDAAPNYAPDPVYGDDGIALPLGFHGLVSRFTIGLSVPLAGGKSSGTGKKAGKLYLPWAPQ